MRAVFLAGWLAASSLAAVAAPGAAAPPLAGSRCAAGGYVDAEFRDAAIRALAPLVVQAPGRPAHGGVRAHHTPGHFDAQGRAWYLVSAYQVNLGLIGALRVAPSLRPVVADWLRWQAKHMSTTGAARGVVFDHWVRVEDHAETTCPPGLARGLCDHVDAYDSTAASTLLMADAYLRYGGDVSLLRDPAMRSALEAAAAMLRELTTAEGLTLAKPTHRAAYTMDGVEVIAGWRAWSRLQALAYAEPASAVNSLVLAERAEAALRARLWDPARSAWRVNDGAGSPQAGRWYPDTMAQAWPLLWGSDPATEARDREAWQRAAAPFQGRTHWARVNVDPDGFWWPSAAVAAACSGDAASTRLWVARARQRWLDPRAPFAWPFQVGDLLWLLWLADPPARPVAFNVLSTPVFP